MQILLIFTLWCLVGLAYCGKDLPQHLKDLVKIVKINKISNFLQYLSEICILQNNMIQCICYILLWLYITVNLWLTTDLKDVLSPQIHNQQCTKQCLHVYICMLIYSFSKLPPWVALKVPFVISKSP